MAKIKNTPKVDRPRERLLNKGPEALSKSDLLAIVLGSGIKGKNIRQLSQQIIKRFGRDFLNTTADDLKKISGIGEVKALQIVAAISLVKRYYAETQANEIVIRNSQDVVSLNHDLRGKKKEYLICLYLNARNVLLKKETVSVGLLDKTLIHPREVFHSAIKLNAAGVIIVHNHPSGDSSPSEKDIQVVEKITQAGEIMGIQVIDFAIISEKGYYSFHEKLNKQSKDFDYVSDDRQTGIFDLLEIEKPNYEITAKKIQQTYRHIPQIKDNHFQLHNRRYIGSKYKLIEWIFSILDKECKGNSFTDIFAGTGVVAAVASKHFDKIILNDFLHSNHVIYKAFFAKENYNSEKISSIIKDYNNINGEDLAENYFSINFGGKYFSKNSAKIIGSIRENIEENKNMLTERESSILIASLLYSVDKIANTVGHYDAYFKKDLIKDNFFMRPIDPIKAKNTLIFNEDANLLAKQIKTDIVYIDPPYNSRQYSRFYHILETLTKWDKPKLHGVALKPPPENMSDYCRVTAKDKLSKLVNDIDAKYLVVSYNNTYESKSSSSQNKIALEEIRDILSRRGKTKIFEKDYRHFNAGNTDFNSHKEYLFVTRTEPSKKIKRSPLFYVGDKYKLMTQLVDLFPSKIDSFYEPFAGGGTVFLNIDAQKYFLNDIDKHLVSIHKFLIANSVNVEKFFLNAEKIIHKYKLSRSYKDDIVPILLKKQFKKTYYARFNKQGYTKLRECVNNNKKNDPLILYILLIYGFNRMLRFNGDGMFNLPVGNVDFNNNVVSALNSYFEFVKDKKIQFTSQDFKKFFEKKRFGGDDFVYFDPPYLIASGEYNKIWGEKEERELFHLADGLHEKGVKFALSNVTHYNGSKNDLLIEWMKQYQVYNIKSNYISYHNNKKKNIKEVLITNY